jgi:hypothetical protein
MREDGDTGTRRWGERARRGKQGKAGNGEGKTRKSVGSDVVSCMEASRSLLLERTKPCKKQGLTPDSAEERGESKSPSRKGLVVSTFNKVQGAIDPKSLHPCEIGIGSG